MSVSFFKHKQALISAYKDVLDESSDTDWALFTYEGKDNELKVAGTGEDGLEELESEFNGSKIMYAFIRVKDPKTSLHKFIFLHWQGEGAPANRKGACASHVRDVERFFKGAHITINARNEDDVTPEQIMEQVKRASASTYAFDVQHGAQDVPSGPVGSVYKKTNAAQEISSTKGQHGAHDEPSEPVGSVYKKTNAAQEISSTKGRYGAHDEPSKPVGTAYKRTNAAEEIAATKNQRSSYEPSKPVGSVYRKTNAAQEISMTKNQEDDDPNQPVVSVYKRINPAEEMSTTRDDSFWARQEREEQARRKEEQRKIADQRKRYAEEVKQQEKESNDRRHQWEKKREKEISEKMKATRLADDRSEVLKKEKERWEAEQREFEAESNRGRKRSESTEKAVEAANLVHQRGENPRTLWQQRISEANNPPPPPANKSLRDRVGSIENYQPPTEEQDQTYDDVYHEEVSQPSNDEIAYQGGSAYEDIPPSAQTESTYDDSHPVYDDIADDSMAHVHQQQSDNQVEEAYEAAEAVYQARALYDYQAADDTEISFDPDDVITNISMIDEGWWQGQAPNGGYGLFPANYVELLQ